MTQEEIFQKVNEIITAKKGFQPDTISMDSTFEELDMDSLDSVELISDLEDHYNVSIPNQELLAIKTVREAVVSLEKLLNA
ncbi:MAG: acyl carrier protein [Sphingobacteriales bacterium]|jgi:acyl carrier protein